jgi:L-ascorbate metabolism protein UlaG (beta-lactamase superfamily)
MRLPGSMTLFSAVLIIAGTAAVAVAQDTGQYPEPERCPRLIAALPDVILAAFTTPTQARGADVQITYVGHSTFLIESPAGVTIATDYNDGVRPSQTPLVATMNRAHSTHFSFNPDPGITHLLPGWGTDGLPAEYDLTVRDVWIRNVTTNIRAGFGASGFQRDMNSMFVFEVAGLCIAHLGHLHHRLTAEHLRALGRIDVVLVPVDGGRTLNTEDMIAVLRDIQAPLVIPMHYFGTATLNRFRAKLDEYYAVVISDSPILELSREGLPPAPTLMILPPQRFPLFDP